MVKWLNMFNYKHQNRENKWIYSTNWRWTGHTYSTESWQYMCVEHNLEPSEKRMCTRALATHETAKKYLRTFFWRRTFSCYCVLLFLLPPPSSSSPLPLIHFLRPSSMSAREHFLLHFVCDVILVFQRFFFILNLIPSVSLFFWGRSCNSTLLYPWSL